MQAVCANCSTENPIDNKFCGSCGALLENARVVTEDRQVEAGARSASEEIAYYADSDVMVTSHRAVFGTTTYAMANITSVSMGHRPPRLMWSPLGILFGLAIFTLAMLQLPEGVAAAILGGAIGLTLVGIGAVIVARAEPIYVIKIASASGEAKAITSENRDYIERIVGAMQQAIVERG